MEVNLTAIFMELVLLSQVIQGQVSRYYQISSPQRDSINLHLQQEIRATGSPNLAERAHIQSFLVLLS